MRLPSLAHLGERALKTFSRFPATLIIAIAGSAAFIVELESQTRRYASGYYNPGISDELAFGLSCLLGLPLFFAIELWLERRGDRLGSGEDAPRRNRPSSRLLLYAIGLVLLGVFYVEYTSAHADALQLFILILAAHLLVSFVAYLRRNETNGFWQFNKMILLRILTSVFYSGVLMIGLSLALLAIDRLFGANIKSETYAELACVLAIFNTWFFLAGVPYSLASQEHRTDYPRGLKIFTQFVLLPLVTIYLAILYPYAVKLLLEWDLPRGWVSNPVLWFAVVGILSFLLLYPIRNEEGNDWIRGFSRYFYIALLPLLALPALGIYTRIRDYGITEERYFVVALTLWLFGIALYFILSKRKDIRVIPITLSILALLSALGPVSAFSVSKRSQFSRLDALLKKHELTGSNRDLSQKRTIPRADFDEMKSITNYFIRTHERGTLESWLETRMPPASQVGNLAYDRDLSVVLNFAADIQDQTSPSFDFGQQTEDWDRITGFDYSIPVEFGPRGQGDVRLATTPELVIDQDRDKITIDRSSESTVIRVDSIFYELIARRDSIIRAGGNSDTMSTTVLREDALTLVQFTLYQGWVRLSSEHKAASANPEVIPSPMDYWGRGALFIKLKE